MVGWSSLFRLRAAVSRARAMTAHSASYASCARPMWTLSPFHVWFFFHMTAYPMAPPAVRDPSVKMTRPGRRGVPPTPATPFLPFGPGKIRGCCWRLPRAPLSGLLTARYAFFFFGFIISAFDLCRLWQKITKPFSPPARYALYSIAYERHHRPSDPPCASQLLSSDAAQRQPVPPTSPPLHPTEQPTDITSPLGPPLPPIRPPKQQKWSNTTTSPAAASVPTSSVPRYPRING